ncbi:16S rRNA (uracil(1498)-N(3))-methyltransferase [Lactobacillus sp. CC-MHH1034]|nr:16S rRNA (uracil(1498)-N(3))-methyltransferase [Agrilactobacillus fermenti]
MRMQPDDQIELVDATQQPFLAVIQKIDISGTEIQVRPINGLNRQTELPAKPILLCGLPKREKSEWIVQKGTELGADKIYFFASERAVSRWDEKKAIKKLQRLQTIALSAAEQSHRNTIPEIKFLQNLKDLKFEVQATKLIAYEESAKSSETKALVLALQAHQPKTPTYCVFGPEGGISSNEVAYLVSQGFTPIGLGPRILRTETAPLYFLSALSFYFELKG